MEAPESNEDLAQLRLSDPGIFASQDNADLMAYLQSYGLPYPPNVRYGNFFMETSQPRYRVRVFGQAWLPDQAIGTIVLVHGFSEHVGNYSRLIHNFLANHYAVTAIDLRGHGLSEGPRGHTDTPTCYAEDIEKWVKLAVPLLAPSRPLYLWGHSLGGQICLQLVLRNQLPVKPSAVTVTSPFLGFPHLTGMKKILAKIAPLLAKCMPTLHVSSGISEAMISSDKAYLAARAEDPLINSVTTPAWVISVRSVIAEIQASATIYAKACPTLMLLAGNEKVTDLLAARSFAFSALSSMRHKVIEFPGMLHELEKEPIRERVVAESLAWFRGHTHRTQ